MFKVTFKLFIKRLYGFISWVIGDYSGKMVLGQFQMMQSILDGCWSNIKWNKVDLVDAPAHAPA